VSNVTTIRSLTVILSSDCNLRCSYCFQNAKHPGRMSWPVLRRALALLLASSRRRVSAAFTGGEPLLEFGLLRRATGYLEAHAPARQSVSLYLATNGMLLSPFMARYLATHEFRVQLSFDGVPEAQHMRGKGTWRRLDALLSHLKHHHARWVRERLSVAITVQPLTLPFLADSIDYLIGKGVGDVRVAPVSGLRLRWRPEQISDVEAHLSRAARLCRQHFRRTGRVPVDIFRRRQSPAESPAPSERLCGVGSPDYLAMDIDGEVSGCALLARSFQRFPDTRLGQSLARLHRPSIEKRNLADGLSRSARELERTGLVENRAGKYSSYGRCGTCRYAVECSPCPVTIACEPRNTDPDRIPDFFCAFNRAAARLRRRFPPVA
jgi:sulfatase maturation enzyme AslB (radical SAM superfamily)